MPAFGVFGLVNHILVALFGSILGFERITAHAGTLPADLSRTPELRACHPSAGYCKDLLLK